MAQLSETVSRRRFVESAMAMTGLGAWVAADRAWARVESRLRFDEGLKPLSEHPPNYEAPVERLTDYLTPTELFFVRSHHEPPRVDLATWKLRITGLVDHPMDPTLAELQAMDSTTTTAVLQCSGNGRSFYQPKVAGVAWVRGAVGNATWTGVSLARLLKTAKVRDNASHVHLISPAPMGEEPFLRSIPLDRALNESTLVALAMNGRPLEAAHGAPARLVIPGWVGNHWIKWLTEIRLSDQPATGKHMDSYRMPPRPVEPGSKPKPSEMEPVTWLNVKSLIVSPTRESTLKTDEIVIRGVAWSGQSAVSQVEVEVNGQWKTATWVDDAKQYGWRRWELKQSVKPGALRIRSRATDASGAVQPETSPWNPNGYLWNGYDEVRCQVNSR